MEYSTQFLSIRQIEIGCGVKIFVCVVLDSWAVVTYLGVMNLSEFAENTQNACTYIVNCFGCFAMGVYFRNGVTWLKIPITKTKPKKTKANKINHNYLVSIDLFPHYAFFFITSVFFLFT